MNRIVNTRFASRIHGASLRMLVLLSALLVGAGAALAQTTAFTYQGRLTDGGNPANGPYDLQVRLFDAATGGNQIGTTNSINGITVTGGVFTATLDFGAAAFPGANRWAEISARPAGNGSFTTLNPRQPVTSTPYAIKSLNAGAADSLSVSCNGCVTGAQIGSLPATSGNYIQNTTASQANSNFNISGNGLIGGNAGIGTTTPVRRLHVSGTGSDDAGVGDLLVSGTGAVGSAITLQATGSGGRSYSWISTASTAGPGGGALAAFDVASGAYRMVINSSGNVGIGTSTPNNILHIRRDASGGVGPTLFVQNGGGTGGAEARLDMSTYDNGANAPNFRMSVVDDGNFGAGVNFQTKTPGAIDNVLASRLAFSSSGVDVQGPLQIRESGNAPTFTGGEGLLMGGVLNSYKWLQSYGNQPLILNPLVNNVGVGVTNPLDRFQVAGDIRIGLGTTGCVKDADGTVITGTCSSDLRFKKDVTPFANMLDKVARLQPVYFNWRASEFPNKHFGNSLSFGLIAQDVEQVLPELVTKDEQGFRAVNYSKLPLLTIQAVKELKAENEALKQQNAALETRLEALEQMMRQLTGRELKQPKQQ